MALRDPDVPQSDDVVLVADLVRLLRIIGPLGRLSVADTVVPVVSVGDVVTRSITVRQPIFRTGDVFTAGVQTAAPAFTEHARFNSPELGIYDVQLNISPHTTEAHVWDIMYANLSGITVVWSVIVPIDGPGFQQTLAVDFTDNNDFIRIRNTTVFGAGVQSVAAIFARLRT